MDLSSEILKEFKTKLKEALASEFSAQGHTLTGAAERGIEITSDRSDIDLLIEVLAPFYVKFVNQGVKSGNIPYSGRTGAGGKSAYITALTDYAKKRMGVSDKEARSIAFAIAETHRKEGMPTRGSFSFSSTGDRLGFVDRVVENMDEQINKLALDLYDGFMETSIDNVIKSSV